MLLNQVQQLGAASQREIPARWQRVIEDTNLERRRRHLPDLELRHTGLSVDAYVNRGNWVADCECNGGMAVSPDWPLCACLDCGRVYDVAVPDQVTIEAATVLLERRVEQNRNWYPAQEPIEVLKRENQVHGLSDAVFVEDRFEFWQNAKLLEPKAIRPGDLNLAIEGR